MSISDTITDTARAAGHTVYNRLNLKFYDAFIVGLSSHRVWRCPSRDILSLYNQNISANHLDIGPGTGYFLDQCRIPARRPRLALMDANSDPLRYCARRLARYLPETYQHDALQPIKRVIQPFHSMGMAALLHCLPGSIEEKAIVFSHLRRFLMPGGVLFGTTVLGSGVTHSLAARKLMAYYNEKEIFHNEADTLAGLESALASRFGEVTVTTRGSIAFFVARNV